MGRDGHPDKLKSIVEPESPDYNLLAGLTDEGATPSERLENQLTLSKRWTIEDDLVESRILEITRTDPRSNKESDKEENTDQLYLVYWLPTEGRAIESFEKPIPWNQSFKIVNIVEELGYSATTVEQIEGERITLTKQKNGSDVEWVAVDPEKKPLSPTEYQKTPHDPPIKDRVKDITKKVWAHPSGSATTGTLFGLGIGSSLAYTISFAFITTSALISDIREGLIQAGNTESDGISSGSVGEEELLVETLVQMTDIIVQIFPFLLLFIILTHLIKGITGQTR